MNTFRRMTVVFFVIGSAVLLLGLSALAAGLRVNTTKSIPVGLYRVSDTPLKKGVYVIFCPPDNPVFVEARERDYIREGFCPGSYSYMMKKVLGVAGDVVTVSAEGVTVNGERLPLSSMIAADSAGRELPKFKADNHTLGSDSLLLMSDVSAISFDARYFGLVDKGQVKDVITPLYILN